MALFSSTSTMPTTAGATKRGRRRRPDFWVLGFVAPGLLVFAVFELYPLVRTFILSVFRWDGFSDPVFVGGQNFGTALHDHRFWQALWHSAVYATGTAAAKLILGLAIALLLDKALRGRAIYRSVVFAPALMSFVAVGLLWSLVYDPTLGPLAPLLSRLGVPGAESGVLADPSTALAAVMLVDVWKWVGYHTVLFLAGLSLVSRDQVEAALIDGANGWQRLRHVTLPAIKQVTVINLVIAVAGALNAFDLVFVMTQGGPYGSTEVMLTYMYSVAFTQNRFGLAAAIACLLFVIVSLATLIIFRLTRERDDR